MVCTMENPVKKEVVVNGVVVDEVFVVDEIDSLNALEEIKELQEPKELKEPSFEIFDFVILLEDKHPLFGSVGVVLHTYFQGFEIKGKWVCKNQVYVVFGLSTPDRAFLVDPCNLEKFDNLIYSKE